MRHLVTWSDYTADEIRHILEVAVDLKKLVRQGIRPPILERRVIGLLFEKPSLRTRVSFESLASQTGASSLFLGEDVGWGKREPIRDFIPILSSYVDCLVIRAKSHQSVIDASELSKCAVINGLTDQSHPCQALADLMTIEEIFGSLEGIKIAYFGDANNVAFSLATLACKFGIRFSIASPVAYQFDSETRNKIVAEAIDPNLFQMTDDPKTAADGAHVLYTDVWTSMGQEDERTQRLADLKEYQVNEELFEVADDSARFLHCLPARRGEEVTEEVIDGPRSSTILQAENRLHAQKGLLVWLLTEARK